MPTPPKLLELDRSSWGSSRGFALANCCALGARAYLRLRQVRRDARVEEA
jgi:hypothetical protein